MQHRIVKAVVKAVGTKHNWKLYDEGDALYSTLTLLKIKTNTGLEGVSGVTSYTNFEFDTSTARYLSDHLAPMLMNSDPFLREEMWRRCTPETYPAPMQARAAVDIALWDLAGKHAGLPIYKLLGGARESLPLQWSSPVYDTIKEYCEWADEATAKGCKAMKIHCWNDFPRDKELVRALRSHSPDGVFMLDVEQAYDFHDALKMARLLEELDFKWFEAPLRDTDTNGYKALTDKVSIPILPGGNSINDLTYFSSCAQQRCWSNARFDVTICGGFTPARKYFAIAEANGLRTEVQSWGHTITSAANLHLMLGLGPGKLGSTVFELATPKEDYEFGMVDTISADENGQIFAPEKPGLGVEVDWEAMDKEAFFTTEIVPPHSK